MSCPVMSMLNIDNGDHKSTFYFFVMKAAVPHSIQMVQLHSIEQSFQAIRSKHVDATYHAKVAATAVSSLSCVAIMAERFGTIRTITSTSTSALNSRPGGRCDHGCDGDDHGECCNDGHYGSCHTVNTALDSAWPWPPCPGRGHPAPRAARPRPRPEQHVIACIPEETSLHWLAG